MYLEELKKLYDQIYEKMSKELAKHYYCDDAIVDYLSTSVRGNLKGEIDETYLPFLEYVTMEKRKYYGGYSAKELLEFIQTNHSFALSQGIEAPLALMCIYFVYGKLSGAEYFFARDTYEAEDDGQCDVGYKVGIGFDGTSFLTLKYNLSTKKTTKTKWSTPKVQGSMDDSKNAKYNLWHSIYDPYIEEITSLDYDKKFSVYAGRKYASEIFSAVSDDIKHLRWKRSQDVSEFTDILVVETDEIYQLDRFVEKYSYIKCGRMGIAESYENTLLEKAVEIKKNGGKIKIITLNNLLDLIVKKAFNVDRVVVDVRNKAKKTGKTQNQESLCEEIITSIISRSKEQGILFTNSEIVAVIEEFEVPLNRFERYISDKHGKTLKEFFEDLGVLKTVKSEFFSMVETLKKRYETKSKVNDVTALIAENADLDMSLIANNAKRLTGLSTREYLVSIGVIANEAPKSVDALTEGVIYKPGEEPENIRKRLDTLFPKLDEAYPDMVIIGLHKDHKKWGETVTDLYKKLGYKSGADFLDAYGYKMSDDKGGRPKAAGGGMEVIEELKRRYPNGANFKDVQALFDANPDLSSKLNTLRTSGFKVDGMTFGKYLKFLGLMEK